MPAAPTPHIADISSFLVEYIRQPSAGGGTTYGYEIYIPRAIENYVQRVENIRYDAPNGQHGVRVNELFSLFVEAAWELCRRGILRPGVSKRDGQSDGEGIGYCITLAGRIWLDSDSSVQVPDTSRMGRYFETFTEKFGKGFKQRSAEAVLCHRFGAYLSSCAMSGAAAESILLAVAIAKTGNEVETLAMYRAASGRKKITDKIVGQASQVIAEQFRLAGSLLSYWRDEASHGTASGISEIEAHDALARLLRFAQLVNDNWDELTKTSA